MENNKILKIEIDQNDHNESDEFIRYEREAAVHDLISENLFEINSKKNYGPLIMKISLKEGSLFINLKNKNDDEIYSFNSSISRLKKIFKDYHSACSNYYESIKNGSIDKIEEIEKVRRKIHNEGAENLLKILNKDFTTDIKTSRRIFTLMYSLYI
tara:strand:- start:18160 stop:18627 length:468 start_codon:yes stop_codon:yes gene_type:complete